MFRERVQRREVMEVATHPGDVNAVMPDGTGKKNTSGGGRLARGVEREQLHIHFEIYIYR